MAARNGHSNGSCNSAHDNFCLYQKDLLPKLPVPNLHSTLDKFLSLMKTVLDPQKYSKTKFLVEEFSKSGGVGEQLQQYLIQQHDINDNWSYKYWLDDMYLNIKLGLPINSNPGGVFPNQKFKNQTQYLRYSAKLLCGILHYKAKVDNGLLQPEKASHSAKGQIMCMDQWYRFLNTYRAPGVEKDALLCNIVSHTEGNKVIVAYRNWFFKLLCGPIGSVPTIDNVVERLEDIIQIVDDESEEAPPIGILTTSERNQWATARSRLLEDPVNQINIKELESCCMLLCLDKRTIPSQNCYEDDPDEASWTEHMLHGQGSQRNTANRWFDVSFQLIIAENGMNGMNMEHSVCEGLAAVDFCEHALVYQETVDSVTSSRNMKLADVVQLKWNVSEENLNDIEIATQQIDGLISDLQLCVLNIDTFGREFPKRHGMSPDSFIQLALQLTYYKIHGKLVSTYESASIRRFRYGRVDVIRGNSPAALQFVRAMVGEWETTDDDKYALMKDAILCQSNYMKDAIQGYGVDLHMLGLREAAKELDIPLPALFTDESCKLFNYFNLSTSQVASRNMVSCFYGAVVPDGYGVCYNPRPNSFYAVVTTFRRCPDTDSTMFANSLEASLLQMQGLCEQYQLIINPPS